MQPIVSGNKVGSLFLPTLQFSAISVFFLQADILTLGKCLLKGGFYQLLRTAFFLVSFLNNCGLLDKCLCFNAVFTNASELTIGQVLFPFDIMPTVIIQITVSVDLLKEGRSSERSIFQISRSRNSILCFWMFGVKFRFQVLLFRNSVNSCASSCVPLHKKKRSSLYLRQQTIFSLQGLLVQICSSSNRPIKRFAQDGAMRVPIAVPLTCWQVTPFYVKQFPQRIRCSASSRNPCCKGLISSSSLRQCAMHLILMLCSMLEQSAVTSMVRSHRSSSQLNVFKSG